MILKLLLHEPCLVHDFLLGVFFYLLKDFRLRFLSWVDSLYATSTQSCPQEFLVQEVLYPGLPLEKRNSELISLLVQLDCVNRANGIHVRAVQLDALAGKREELLHRVSV